VEGGRIDPVKVAQQLSRQTGSMIRKSITGRISRRARRLKKVGRNRGPIGLPTAEQTTVERRERDGRPSRCRNRRPALSRK